MILKDFKTEEEKIQFLKTIYDYCMDYKWDDVKLRHIGKKLNIQGNTVNELAKMYIDYMNLSEIAYQRLIEQIEELEKISNEKYHFTYKTNPILYQYGIITYKTWNNDFEKELVLKTIYHYAKKVDFSTEKIEKLAYEIGLNYVTIKKYAREYAKNYLKIEEDIWVSPKEKTDITILEEMLKDIYTYCEHHKYSKESIKYLCEKYNFSEPTILKKAQQYAEEYLYESREHYLLRRKKFKEQNIKREEEKKLQEIYEYCEKYNYSKEAISYLSNIYLVSRKTIVEKAKKYAIEYLYITEEQWREKREKHRIDNQKLEPKSLSKKMKELYQKLLLIEEKEEIYNLINESNYDVIYIQNKLEEYLKTNNKITELEIITKKLEIYKEYQKEIKSKKKKEKLKKYLKSKNIIELYVNSDLKFIDEFCQKENITRGEFKKSIINIKENNKKLYNQYLVKEATTLIEYQRKFEYLLEQIKNNITENGITRSFDVLDYYEIIDISLSKALEIIKELKFSETDYELLRKFILKYKPGEIDREYEIPMYLKERVEINFKYDKFGKPIIGSGEVISTEVKLKLIEYLKELNLPINRIMYNVVFKRYRLGLINIENQKSKILTK